MKKATPLLVLRLKKRDPGKSLSPIGSTSRPPGRPSHSEARSTRLRPRHKVGEEGGLGAWEVGARYSHLDLTDRNVNGGVLNDVTWAVNWYLNDYSRVMFNAIRGERQDFSPVWIFQTRLQLVF